MPRITAKVVRSFTIEFSEDELQYLKGLTQNILVQGTSRDLDDESLGDRKLRLELFNAFDKGLRGGHDAKS